MLSKINFGKRSNRHPERSEAELRDPDAFTLKLSWRDPSTFARDNDGLSLSSETSAVVILSRDAGGVLFVTLTG